MPRALAESVHVGRVGLPAGIALVHAFVVHVCAHLLVAQGHKVLVVVLVKVVIFSLFFHLIGYFLRQNTIGILSRMFRKLHRN